MCCVLKYGIWNVSQPKQEAVNALVSGGYGPLASMILAARGLETPAQANAVLDCNAKLPNPFSMKDMALAAERVRRAIAHGEKIAVFGDYDVDGITATCLLTEEIRKQGGTCVPYIPGRMEEGYGLNSIAIRQLSAEGVKLIVTVDCGITALGEAQLCKQLGIELVITDHHECKQTLPEAVAVVDPHRLDETYPHKTLSGVGVAFKLAAAMRGDQQQVLEDYADLVCLGTVADVMPMQGENRAFVHKGLQSLRNTRRPGVLALLQQCSTEPESISASTVGYVLAPRINAAGRMGQIHLALELFLTEDPRHAEAMAKALCDLNRQRQAVESEIYQQALQMLPKDTQPEAVVLAHESWHQGVVGIVASRIAEEFCCPTVLICLDGENGKASSRSYNGFNLFAALTESAELLESFGGHELAAGFTILRENIPAFRERLCALAREYYDRDTPRTVLELDCAVTPDLLTLPNFEALECLEPCGSGCSKPALMLEGLSVDRISQVGGGRHMRLRLRKGRYSLSGIYFSANAQTASIAQGDLVDVAFVPQINHHFNERTVQLNVLDIRPSCKAECDPRLLGYPKLLKKELDSRTAAELLPERGTLATVWRYLEACQYVKETPMCLCRKIVRRSEQPLSLGQLLTCLDIFSEVQLLRYSRLHKYIEICLLPHSGKADLSSSPTMQRLLQAKESV